MERISTEILKVKKPKRKKMGRPRLPVKKVSVNYRLTEENRDWMAEYSNAVGFSLSTAINKAVEYYRFAIERASRRSARG